VNMLSIIERIPTEAAAYEYLEFLRWHGQPICPHCDSERCYLLNSTRITSTGKASARRLWKCGACRKQFSVLTGTVMHGSKIPIRTWVLVMFEMTSNKNGIAAREIERRYDLTPKSAWFLLHRIREAMKPEWISTLGGNVHTVVADETFIGGKPKNRHQQGKPRPGTSKGHAGRADNKIPVLSLIDRNTGEVRSRVVNDVTGATLRKAISEQVDMAGSILYTDAAGSYRQLGREFQRHAWVDHSSNEYVRGDVSTNQAENFFSQLKRSIDGTHHHVSKEHLGRYLAEFDFRYSTKKADDTERLRKLVSQVAGRRLSYRPLVERP